MPPAFRLCSALRPELRGPAEVPYCRFSHYHGTRGKLGRAADVVGALVAAKGIGLRQPDVEEARAKLRRQGAVVD